MSDDLEQRLTAWAEEARAAAGDPPPPLLEARRAPQAGLARRYAGLLAVAAAVVLAALVAVGIDQVRSAKQDAHPAATPSPTGAPDSDVVPWADLPMGPMIEPSQLPDPPRDLNAPRCEVASLRLSMGDLDGATGTLVSSVDVTNGGQSTCVLDGQIQALTAVSRGRRIQVKLNHGTEGFLSGIEAGTLAPGASGLSPVSWYPRCDNGPTQRSYGPLKELRAMIRGVTVPVTGSLDIGCSDPEKVGIAVGPLGVRHPAPRFAHDPLMDLSATISLPPVVQAGSTLHAVVTLTNNGAQAVDWKQCPSYLFNVTGDFRKGGHQLNCAAAKPIAPGSSEGFAMQLEVPPGEPDGPADVHWLLLTPTDYTKPSLGTSAAGTIRISGGAVAVPTAASCPEGDTSAPCEHAEPNRRYPYVVYTHCGLTPIRVDGVLWYPQQTTSSSAPEGFDDPYDAGTVEVVKQRFVLTFTSRRGRTAQFVTKDHLEGGGTAQLCD